MTTEGPRSHSGLAVSIAGSWGFVGSSNVNVSALSMWGNYSLDQTQLARTEEMQDLQRGLTRENGEENLHNTRYRDARSRAVSNSEFRGAQ